MFILFAPLAVLTGIAAYVLLRLPIVAASGGRRGPRDRSGGGGRLSGLSPGAIIGVLRTPRLGVFFIASVAVWTSHAALQGFVSLRVVELGGSPTMVAATWSLGAVLEVFLMATFPALARRFGVEVLLVVGALGFAARALISGLVSDPSLIVFASLFGGIGFSFFYVGTVSWVSAAVGRGVQATAQGVFTGTSNSTGAILGSVLGGAIGNQFGLPVLFLLSAVGYTSGAVLVWFAITRPTRRARSLGETARPRIG
jgi:PPP family 3-phenylpropionic acid transporter